MKVITNNGNTYAFDITAYLGHGSDEAVHARELADRIGVSNTRSVRALITEARNSGSVIISEERGYYLPSLSAQDAVHELQSFLRRQDAVLRTNRSATRSARAMLKELTGTEIDGQGDLFNGEKENVLP